MDDDYVAQILAKEAKESSVKYSSQGLSALMSPSRPASNAPKPNTRFLRNLIKVTDSHNSALKLKEEKDARERMRQLKSQASRASASTSTDRTSGGSSRRHERARSRDRRDDKEDRHRSDRKRHRSRSSSIERDRPRRHRRDENREGGDRKRGSDSHRHASRSPEPSRKDRRERDREHTRRRRHRSYSRSRSRSRSPRRDRNTDRRRHRREDRKSDRYSRSRSRSHSPEPRKSRSSRHTDPSPRRSREATRRDRAPPTLKAPTEADDDSDPLEDLVGPLPPRKNEAPIISRGRGAYKPNMSNIDAHFAPGYDPTTDVHLEDNMASTGEPSRRPVAGLMTKDDDWDMALEALRDRQRWKQKGEERLRAAGINEATIDQWKNNTAFTGSGGEGNPEDVQWSKKGEGREWDRGKFVDDDGHIDIRAAW
ncbi:unnamed protein product [Penicillium olsonii]|nr:unnamed protein product [Penicillium olsonii]